MGLDVHARELPELLPLVVAGVASTLADGMERGATALDTGAAANVLDRHIEATNR